jgi:hypothetical protein
MLLLRLSIFCANLALSRPDPRLTTQAYVVLGRRRGEVLAASPPGETGVDERQPVVAPISL